MKTETKIHIVAWAELACWILTMVATLLGYAYVCMHGLIYLTCFHVLLGLFSFGMILFLVYKKGFGQNWPREAIFRMRRWDLALTSVFTLSILFGGLMFLVILTLISRDV